MMKRTLMRIQFEVFLFLSSFGSMYITWHFSKNGNIYCIKLCDSDLVSRRNDIRLYASKASA